MSCYRGNHEECPCCGLTYGSFRTGLSYRAVFEMLMDNSEDPADWRNKTRHTILGKWHELKMFWWAHHLEECRRQRDFVSESHGDAWEPIGCTYEPGDPF